MIVSMLLLFGEIGAVAKKVFLFATYIPQPKIRTI